MRKPKLDLTLNQFAGLTLSESIDRHMNLLVKLSRAKTDQEFEKIEADCVIIAVYICIVFADPDITMAIDRWMKRHPETHEGLKALISYSKRKNRITGTTSDTRAMRYLENLK